MEYLTLQITTEEERKGYFRSGIRRQMLELYKKVLLSSAEEASIPGPLPTISTPRVGVSAGPVAQRSALVAI